MSGLLGTNMGYLLQRLWRRVRIVAEEPSAPWFWTPAVELLVVGITVPILVALVVWLGSVLAVSLTWTLVVATILGLACVMPYMLNRMRSSTPTVTDATPSIALTNLAQVASNFFAGPDYERSCGQMTNSVSDDLSPDQVELLITLLIEYQDKAGLNQKQWAEAQSTLDWLDALLEDVSGS
jgi:hypothetical protein